MSADDPGKPNPPGRINAQKIRWEEDVPGKWWRNSHKAASAPFAFTSAESRFSAPSLPHAVLYLGVNPIACFWESGLGRDLNSRMPDDLKVAESDLKDHFEYTIKLKTTGLRFFNATDAAARRSIGAKTSACFSADHALARAWAEALMNSGCDGILYESARQSPGLCLALFDTPAIKGKLSGSRKVGSAYDDAPLLAQLLAEGVVIVGN
ncbi:MAG: RES family NAD+ phosphorylase [Terrimicrobiaceae bacterium]|nr:RES family NAD+ phosphorylase [Terrimicrobiaceae bacterium]